MSNCFFVMYAFCMALIKGIENVYGATFNYHKISDVRITNRNGDIQLCIVVDSYIDKKARDEGKRPVQTENVILHADFALAPFYQLLRAKFGDYSDSEDVFEEDKIKSKRAAVMIQQTTDGRTISKYEEKSDE